MEWKEDMFFYDMGNLVRYSVADFRNYGPCFDGMFAPKIGSEWSPKELSGETSVFTTGIHIRFHRGTLYDPLSNGWE